MVQEAMPDILEATALITAPGNFRAYMTELMRSARNDLAEKRLTVDVATAALERTRLADAQEGAASERAVLAAERAGDHGQARRWRRQAHAAVIASARRLAFAKKHEKRAENFLGALELGYVPLPRLPAVSLDHCYRVMPPDVLEAYAEAVESGVFDEIRIVDGRQATAAGRPISSATGRHDPVMVGMIGHELFAIAWWR